MYINWVEILLVASGCITLCGEVQRMPVERGQNALWTFCPLCASPYAAHYWLYGFRSGAVGLSMQPMTA
jgi:hypothetical protein